MRRAQPNGKRASPAAGPAARAALPPSWPEQVHGVLRELRVQQVAYVPDSGHARLIELVRSDRTMRAVILTTEEEGVALALGAWLGGARSALLLQSSGVGNCINMLGMIEECRAPLLMLVTMRGEWGEFNPWQVPMAQATVPALQAMRVVVRPVEAPEEIAGCVAAAARLAFQTNRAAAVLIGQRAIGAKEFSHSSSNPR